jgi:hypothetical protein
MAKKVRDDDDDEDFDDEIDNDNDHINEIEEDEEDFEDDKSKGSCSDLDLDEYEELDILIEIDEDDLDINNSNEKKENVDVDDIILSKHKVEGKHSLKYDSIFKGKKEEPLDDDEMDGFAFYHKDSIEVDKSSNYYFESIDNENYVRTKLVKERVYAVLTENTSLNFMNNRRKPSRNDFNQYYCLLKQNLESESFTNVELFNELSVYFSDNLFNMFKLLDNRWRNLIIKELQDHIGKNVNSKQVINRNIYEGTEIEFMWEDEFGEDKLITGVVITTDYENSTFQVDSYENVYDVHISVITQILNNTKFKYNLNKLNNIDFL